MLIKSNQTKISSRKKKRVEKISLRNKTYLAARCEETTSYHLAALGKESPGFSRTAAYTLISSFVN